MQIKIRREGDVAIADLKGRLVLGEPQETLRDSFEELIAEGYRKIVLNVSGLARLDSSGIGELVACMKTARATDARLALLEADEQVRRILGVSQILPLFESYQDEGEALTAMAQA